MSSPIRTLDNATATIIAALEASDLIESVELVARTRGSGRDSDKIALKGHLEADPTIRFNLHALLL